MSFVAPAVSLYDTASLPPPRQYSDKEIADTIDSAILFMVSFLLFSVFAKPLIKAIRLRIWNSRALKVQALVLLAIVWWRRRDWFRARVPKLAMLEDVIVMVLSLARSAVGPILDRLVPLFGVALLLLVVWMALGQEGFTLSLHGVLEGPPNRAAQPPCAAKQAHSSHHLAAPLATPCKPVASAQNQTDQYPERGRTKMLKLPLNMLSELVVAIDEIRAQNSPARGGVAAIAGAVAGAARNCPASCPALAKRSAKTAVRGIAKTALALAQVIKPNSRPKVEPARCPKADESSSGCNDQFFTSRSNPSVYHRSGCRHVSSKMVHITSSELIGRNLRPCCLCN